MFLVVYNAFIMITQNSSRTVKTLPRAYLFDVDGVLSDPKEKRVVEEELFTHISRILERGEPVGLNTGRSTVWLEKKLIKPLLEKTSDKKIFNRFLAIGEKGTTWMDIDDNGQIHNGRDKRFVIPQKLYDDVASVTKKYQDAMFIDTTKETMISIEMNDGYDIDTYTNKQQSLLKELRPILAKTSYEIEPSIIAIDIQYPEVGKAYGADRFLNFLEDKKLDAEIYLTFGDSPSDIHMADELHNRGKKVEFIYVGNKEKIHDVRRDYIIENIEGFSQGTLLYLTR